MLSTKPGNRVPRPFPCRACQVVHVKIASVQGCVWNPCHAAAGPAFRSRSGVPRVSRSFFFMFFILFFFFVAMRFRAPAEASGFILPASSSTFRRV